MNLTKIKDDKQPVDLLIELVEWHGIDKCKKAYKSYLKDLDPIYFETMDYSIDELDLRQTSIEIADAIRIDHSYYVNDAPAIETELIKFLEEWE